MNLETGRDDDERKLGNLDRVTDRAFLAGGRLARRGTKHGETGWYLDGAEIVSALPSNVVARWSPRGATVAYYETGDPQAIMVGPIGALQRVELENNIRALEWNHDESGLFILITDDQGASSLVRLELPSGQVESIGGDLDAPLRASSIGVAPNGQAVYLPLASSGALAIEPISLPDPLRTATLVSWSPVAEEIAIETDAGNGRQSIWILDLQSRQAEKVIEYESDTYSGLDWTPDGETIVYSARSEGRFQVFAVSRSGGAPVLLSEDRGNLLQPQVSPDGRWIAATRIEFTRELWRQSAIED